MTNTKHTHLAYLTLELVLVQAHAVLQEERGHKLTLPLMTSPSQCVHTHAHTYTHTQINTPHTNTNIHTHRQTYKCTCTLPHGHTVTQNHARTTYTEAYTMNTHTIIYHGCTHT